MEESHEESIVIAEEDEEDEREQPVAPTVSWEDAVRMLR